MLTRRQLLAAAGSAAWLSQTQRTAQTRPAAHGRIAHRLLGRTARARATRPSTSWSIVTNWDWAASKRACRRRLPTRSRASARKLEDYNMRVVFNVPLPRKKEDHRRVRHRSEGRQGCRCHGAACGTDAAPLRAVRFVRCVQEELRTESAFGDSRRAGAAQVPDAARASRITKAGVPPSRPRGSSAWAASTSASASTSATTSRSVRLRRRPSACSAPLAVFCHIKDMGVEPYTDGFLLSEVPFGEGVLNLKQMVQTLRERDPNMLFCLEMITRDPLKVPVLTDKYWATFDDSYSPLPARDLAKVLELVRDNPPKKPLPKITGLSPADQVKAEDDYNQQCVDYATQTSGPVQGDRSLPRRRHPSRPHSRETAIVVCENGRITSVWPPRSAWHRRHRRRVHRSRLHRPARPRRRGRGLHGRHSRRGPDRQSRAPEARHHQHLPDHHDGFHGRTRPHADGVRRSAQGLVGGGRRAHRRRPLLRTVLRRG